MKSRYRNVAKANKRIDGLIEFHANFHKKATGWLRELIVLRRRIAQLEAEKKDNDILKALQAKNL